MVSPRRPQRLDVVAHRPGMRVERLPAGLVVVRLGAAVPDALAWRFVSRYVGAGAVHEASLTVQDILRWLIIAAILVGSLLKFVGAI